jgi:hypothetical protein
MASTLNDSHDRVDHLADELSSSSTRTVDGSSALRAVNGRESPRNRAFRIEDVRLWRWYERCQTDGMRILRIHTVRGIRFMASVPLLFVGGATVLPAVGCTGADAHGCGGYFNPTVYEGACGCVDTEEVASGFECNIYPSDDYDPNDHPPGLIRSDDGGGAASALMRDAGEHDADAADAASTLCDADADASSSCTERDPSPTSHPDASDARP